MKMVERVARALCREAEEMTTQMNGEQCWRTLGFPSLEAWTAAVWPNYVPAARAAIEAMREPTEAMVAAYDAHDLALVASGYDAMIDAVLAEPVDSRAK